MSFDPASTDIPTRLTVVEAKARVRALCTRYALGSERVPLDRALGRVLAADIVADDPIPPFANSAMDGYAVRGSDLPADGERMFALAGVMLAGARERLEVGAAACVRITTGAPLPRGADTVVMKERVRVEGEAIVIRAGEVAGSNVRPAGEDFSAGTRALARGDVMTAGRVGVAAACGRGTIEVARRPRVALIVTGDELVALDRPLAAGEIHDSNRYSLGALLRGSGIEPIANLHVRDEPDALRSTLREIAYDADVIVTSGGVSAGEADHLPAIVAEIGRIDFWKVRMKPGMPMLCGEIDGTIVFALPGNPVSSFVTFLTLVAPALAAIEGARAPTREWRARLGEPVRKRHDRTEFLRARVRTSEDGALVATPLDRQGSGMMRGVAEADALIEIPEDAHELEAGAVVDMIPLPGWT